MVDKAAALKAIEEAKTEVGGMAFRGQEKAVEARKAAQKKVLDDLAAVETAINGGTSPADALKKAKTDMEALDKLVPEAAAANQRKVNDVTKKIDKAATDMGVNIGQAANPRAAMLDLLKKEREVFEKMSFRAPAIAKGATTKRNSVMAAIDRATTAVRTGNQAAQVQALRGVEREIQDLKTATAGGRDAALQTTIGEIRTAAKAMGLDMGAPVEATKEETPKKKAQRKTQDQPKKEQPKQQMRKRQGRPTKGKTADASEADGDIIRTSVDGPSERGGFGNFSWSMDEHDATGPNPNKLPLVVLDGPKGGRGGRGGAGGSMG